MVEADMHCGNLFAVLVGATSSGRKGTSWGYVKRCFEAADEKWSRSCLISGLSSGEGLIWSVRDPVQQNKPIKDKGRATSQSETLIIDQGVEDKRALVIESEFASVLRVQGREGNTLSAVIRQAWDSGNLRSLVKNSPARATDAHISIIGHITNEELQCCLNGAERFNGYVNRFLWILSCRSKFLPEGGKIHEENFAGIIRRLTSAIEGARRSGEMQRDEEARKLWREVYPDLTAGRSGLLGALTARAAPQIVRLSLLYALLGLSDTVQKVHLEAALALWKYSEDSSRYVFGVRTGDLDADAILRALREAGAHGLRQTEINGLFHGHKTRNEIARSLATLSESGLVTSIDEETTGRPAKRWYAVTYSAEKEGKGSSREAYFASSADQESDLSEEIYAPLENKDGNGEQITNYVSR